MDNRYFQFDEPMRSELIDTFAMQIARHRCNGQVYMDGKHYPKPTETYLARDLVQTVEWKIHEVANG
jgi:hypothetical protein